MTNEVDPNEGIGFFQKALGTVNTLRFPLNVIAFTLLLSTVLITLVASGNPNNFKYAIHAFLAVVACFFATLWFCPKSLYYPEDLIKIEKAGVSLNDKPIRAVLAVIAGVVVYMIYQLLNE